MPAVVVTGSIAEMIGGGVTPEGSNLLRFIPRTIDEDQWQSADRAIYWLWTEFGAKKAKPQAAPSRLRGPSRASTSSARSTAPSTCRPTSPKSAAWSKGIGCDINLVFPLGAHDRATSRGCPKPTSMSACIANSAGSSAKSWTG